MTSTALKGSTKSGLQVNVVKTNEGYLSKADSLFGKIFIEKYPLLCH